MPGYTTIVTVSAVFVPIFVYLIVAWSRKGQALTIGDYFNFGKSLEVSDLTTTTVGYGLQLAAIVLFAAWGIEFGLGGFLVPLFWALGFIFLSLFADKFVRIASRNDTIHGFLGDPSGVGNKRKVVQILASLATIIGIGGALFAEFEYAKGIFTFTGLSSLSLSFLKYSLLVFCLIYVLGGGYKAVVVTDTFQVPIAYIGFLAVSVFLGYWSSQVTNNIFVAIAVSVVVLFLLLTRLRQGNSKETPIWKDWSLLTLIGIFAFSAIMVIVSLFVKGKLSLGSLSPVNVFDSHIWFGQGIGIIGLFLANAFWQFIDLANWQRLGSLKTDSDNKVYANRLKRGLRLAGIESGLGWGIGVLFAFGLNYSGIVKSKDQAWSGLSLLCSSLGGISQPLFDIPSYLGAILLFIFLAGVVAILLSSTDSFISAIAFTCYSDFLGKEVQQTKDDGDGLPTARLATIFCVIVLMVLYELLKVKMDILTLTYVAYSAQLGLFASIIIAIFIPKIYSWLPATVSIVVGVFAAFYSGLVGFSSLSAEANSVMPPALAIGGGLLAFFAVAFLQKIIGKKSI